MRQHTMLPHGLHDEGKSPYSHTQPKSKLRRASDGFPKVTVLADGNVMKHQKSRQRKVFSCMTCHKKKIKCTRDQPVCMNCQRSASECKYFVNKRVSRGGRPRAESSENKKGADKIPQDSQTDESVPSTRHSSLSLPAGMNADSLAAPLEDSASASVSGSVSGSASVSASISGSISGSASAASLGVGPGTVSQTTLTSMEVTKPENNTERFSRGSVSGISTYSASSLSPEAQPKLPGLAEKGVWHGRDSSHLDHMTTSPPFGMFQGGVSPDTMRHVLSTDSVSKMTERYFDANYSITLKEGEKRQEAFGQGSGHTQGRTQGQSQGQYSSQGQYPAYGPDRGLESYSTYPPFNRSSLTTMNHIQGSPMAYSSSVPERHSDTNMMHSEVTRKSSLSAIDAFSPDSSHISRHVATSGKKSDSVSRDSSRPYDASPRPYDTSSRSHDTSSRPYDTSSRPYNLSTRNNDSSFHSYDSDLHHHNSGFHHPDTSSRHHSTHPQMSAESMSMTSSVISLPSHHPAPLVSAQENALNPYSSNPATTVNYLYGTNVNYHNGNIFQSLLAHLPKRERSYELVQRYLYSVHDLLPIMPNMSEFVREHDRFWAHMELARGSSTSYEQDTQDFDFLQFYTLYFPVVYASTISEFEEYDNLLLNQDIDKFLRAFNKICQHFNYPHGLKSIALLLGNVIIQSTSPNPSTMEMSQIIRYAKFLHLHKDPVKTLRIQDSQIVGFRRKLWWVIFGLDALSSHNFCLPPVCRFSDFNVEIPEHYDHMFDKDGQVIGRTLNVGTLAMSVKFHFDRILSDLVYHLHNGLAANITPEEIQSIRDQISSLFVYIHSSVLEINAHYEKYPPQSVSESNMFNFVKHHSWSFADRALMLLHKKILLTDRSLTDNTSLQTNSRPLKSGDLSLNQYEDTFGRVPESNIIKNFQESSIASLRFGQTESFSYNDLSTNLIPSILHNLNDFLKYNDFIKFGKFNWYVKRTIPLDSVILLLAMMSVKLKYDFMGTAELSVYVKLVNKTLFILNRKYFKNEKYKRMLSLTNATWEYILKKYDVACRISSPNGGARDCSIEFLDHQVTGIRDMSELFTIMEVPQPAMVVNGKTLTPPHGNDDSSFNRELTFHNDHRRSEPRNSKDVTSRGSIDGIQSIAGRQDSQEEMGRKKSELMHLNNKIYYDLRNNFVDINDYCTFYSSLENVLHALMDFINEK